MQIFLKYHLLSPLFVGWIFFSSASLAFAADLELGEYLSSQCTACHQVSGESNGIPSIVGWDTEEFVKAMNAYKNKERDNEAMQNIAFSLSGEEITALAAYFALRERDGE